MVPNALQAEPQCSLIIGEHVPCDHRLRYSPKVSEPSLTLGRLIHFVGFSFRTILPSRLT